MSELIGDKRIQGVALTGSEGAGSVVGARASEMLKKSTLELGGSDVFVVLDDADIEKAAKEGAAARLSNAGQACTAAKRFVVQAAVADAFTEAFTREIKGYVLGDADGSRPRPWPRCRPSPPSTTWRNRCRRRWITARPCCSAASPPTGLASSSSPAS